MVLRTNGPKYMNIELHLKGPEMVCLFFFKVPKNWVAGKEV